jgi:transcriptional regulator with XRE-family HTH domain
MVYLGLEGSFGYPFLLKRKEMKIIKELRQKYNMTQQQLAAKSGLATSFVSHIETGKREPSISSLKAIAKAFGISVNILFLLSIEIDELLSVEIDEIKISQELQEEITCKVGSIQFWIMQQT